MLRAPWEVGACRSVRSCKVRAVSRGLSPAGTQDSGEELITTGPHTTETGLKTEHSWQLPEQGDLSWEGPSSCPCHCWYISQSPCEISLKKWSWSKKKIPELVSLQKSSFFLRPLGQSSVPT